MRPLPTDTAASFRAALALFRNGEPSDEERAHLRRLEEAERPRPIAAAKRAA